MRDRSLQRRLSNSSNRSGPRVRCAAPHFAGLPSVLPIVHYTWTLGGHVGGHVMTIIAMNRRGFLGAMLLASAVVTGRRAYADAAMEEIGRLKPGEFTWRPERAAGGTGRRRRVAARAARACLSQRRPHRRLHLFDRQARPCDADRRLRHAAEGQESSLEHLQRRADAQHEPAHLVGRRAACRQSARLSGVAWLRAAAVEILAKLFGVTHIGTPVIIAGAPTDPWELTHPGMVLSGYAEQEFEQVLVGP